DPDAGTGGLMAFTVSPPASIASAPAAPRRPVASPAWRHVDLVLVLAGASISALGVLMVYSTTRPALAAAGGDLQSEMKKQAIYAVVGVGAFVATAFFDYKRYLSWAPLLYVGSLLALLATFAIGHRALGAESWIQVGSIQVEPSELVKVTLILSLAALLARRQGSISGKALVVVLALSVLPFALIYKQNALGSAMVLAVVMVGMLLMAGTKGRHMIALALLAAVAIGGSLQLGVLKQYQRDRIESFLTAPTGVSSTVAATGNPYAATIQYNLDQSKAAIADGGLRGKGLYRGYMTNLSYVPNQYTDFIFTAVAEQFGFVGSALLLALFVLVVWRTWRAAAVSRDLAGTLICIGVLSMIMFQVFENVGMTMGIMPVAGITLPFMSYGGSSMLVDWVAVGLVVNVGMRRFS
ncbi:MAG TPA: FtsW/RodA/SpoVE family cell cycle protein, partial [Acidimicrobiales bacterium]|nr:FtsW/RodA/SpoVE family cell cycle protein [Acidimicrobiales bacterium]